MTLPRKREQNGPRAGLGKRARACVCAVLLSCASLTLPLAYAQTDKSGVSPNAVHLPAGPGTVDGPAAGFDADLTTGTATYSIPLEMMPQSTDTTVNIELGYEAGGGNGILGFGWGLSYGWASDLGDLRRRTEHTLPRYVDGPNGKDDDGDGTVDEADEQDTYVAEGGELLVDQGDGHYLAQIIGANYRYSRYCNKGCDPGPPLPPEPDPDPNAPAPSSMPIYDPNPLEFVCAPAVTQDDGSPCEDGWLVEYPQGYGAWVGQTAQSRIVNPATGEIFAWLLDEEFDTTQNRNIYKYTSFNDERNLNNKYLSEIEQVNYSTWSGDLCGAVTPYDSFSFAYFVYEDRDDMFESCESGFPVRTGKRLKEIVMGVQANEALVAADPLLDLSNTGHAKGDFNNDGTPDYLVRRYVLQYKPGHWSYLASITQYGADNVSTLPPVTMTYNNCELPDTLDVSGSVITSVNTPRTLMDLGSVDITELNGDGLVDILKTEPAGGLHTAYLNLGESTLPSGKKVITWADGQAIQGDARTMNINLQEDVGYSAYLADMDADGLSDLVYDADETYYFPLRQASVGVPTWGARTRMNLDPDTQYPPSPYGTEHTSDDDLNNDGLTDIIQSIRVGGQAYFRIWYNLGGYVYSSSQLISQENALTLTDDGAGLEDFNGDGISDLVRVLPAGVEVSRGLGYGHFDARVLVPFPDITLSITQAQSAGLEDVNSDGLPDLLIEHAAPGEMWYWINLGDYRFDHRRKFTGVPTPVGGSAATRWADINGNTTSDFILADRYSTPALVAVDFGAALGCDLVQGLMTKIDNGVGGSISFEYGNSAEYQLADAAAGRPWPDTMPESQIVIKSKTESDGYGDDYVTRYVYHDGFFKYFPDYDSFAGFGEVEEITEGDIGAPTLVHRMKFDVGRDDPSFRGNLVYESQEDETGAKFWEENTQYTKTVLYVGPDGREIKLVNPIHRTRDILERGQGTPRRIESEYDYDNYGNVTLDANYGIVDGANRGAFNDETIQRNLWTWNCYGWIVADPAREDIEDLSGKRISRHEIYWDNETYLGDRFRWSITNGITRELKFPDPYDLDHFVEISRIKYDVSGNDGHRIDGMAECDADGEPDHAVGHWVVLDYEDYFQQYCNLETHFIGGGKADLAATYDWDYGYGRPIAARDFNGFETRYKYDTFGRLIAVIRPGDTDALPTQEFEYGLALDFEGGLINYIETRKLDHPEDMPGASHRDHYAISRTWLDGMGRELLTKTEAEPNPDTGAPRVVVTGSGNWSARGNVGEDFNDYFSTQPGATLDELLAYENIGDPAWTGLAEDDGQLKVFNFDNFPRTVHDFDAQLREIKTINPDGTFSTTTFEPLRQIVRDENDNDASSASFDTPKTYIYDGQERLVQVDEQVRLNDDGTPSATLNTWSTKYTYRADGLLTEITDAQGNIRHYIYDGLGRLLSRNDPDIGETSNEYDDAGNLIHAIDGKDAGTLYTYDGANRLLTIDIKDEGKPFSFGFVYDPTQPITDTNRPDVAYFYDDVYDVPVGGGATAPTRNAIGQESWVQDKWGSYYYSYDERGREEWEVSRLPHPDNLAEVYYQANFTYDSQDRVTQVEFPDGDHVGYAYNERGLLGAVIGGAPIHANASPNMLSEISYNPSGLRASQLTGDGIKTTRAYDNRQRLVSLRSYHVNNAAEPILDYAYKFDGNNSIVRIDDLRPESVHPAGNPLRNTQIITMDDLDRIKRIQYSFAAPGAPDADNGSINYRYDRLGNLISQTSDIVDVRDGISVTDLGTLTVGGPLGSSGRDGATDDTPGPNALTHVQGSTGVRDIEYDDGGELSVLDGVKLYYDYDGNLVQAESPKFVAKFTYDYDGLRVLKRVWDKDAAGKVADHPHTFVQYLSDYFEIREHEQVQKYAFDGLDTLALVSGTLQPGLTRYQRLRVSDGWNLLSLAVNAPDAAAQLGLGGTEVLAIWLIDPATGALTELAPSDPLPAGSAFWLYTTTDDDLEVAGQYDDAIVSRTAQQGYVALGRIGATNIERSLPAGDSAVWGWDADEQDWRIQISGPQAFLSDLQGYVENGKAFYVRLAAAGDISSEPAVRGVDYYHPDHLSSSNIITDGAGNVVEENVYYPFGVLRASANVATHTVNPYGFINREHDVETNLSSFEERYLAPGLGRFVTSDPVLDDVPDTYLLDPQQLNPYSYTANNPITFYDPQGTDRQRANAVVNKLNPYAGLTGAALTQKRQSIFGGFQIAKGGAIPKFDSSFLNKRKKVRDEIAKIKQDNGFDINNFKSLDRKLGQLATVGLDLGKDFGKTPIKLETGLLRDFLFQGDSKTAKVGDRSKKKLQFNAEALKQINALKDRLDNTDLSAQFDKLSQIGEASIKKTGFNFQQSQVDALSKGLGDPSKQFKLKE